jgi:hypothetical protein
VLRANVRLDVKADYLRRASFKVYASTAPGCIVCLFASYPRWSSLCHERSLPIPESLVLSDRPDAGLHAVANFALTEFYEVGQEFIGNSSPLTSVAESADLGGADHPALVERRAQ